MGPMATNPKPAIRVPILTAAAEVCLIVFLLYAVLLMAEFSCGNGEGKSLGMAVQNIFTLANFEIAVISGIIGCFVIEYLRRPD